MWRRERIQAEKYSSVYCLKKFPQPSKADQHSNSKNTQNATKIFCKKTNPKAHNRQIQQGWNKGENTKGSQRESRVTHKGKPFRLTVDLSAETLQARREWGPIFNILKEKNFQPKSSYPAKLSFMWRRNKILYEQAIAQRFHHRQASFTRAPERSTKHRKEQPVPATPKTYQMVKSIDTMKKLHQLTRKTSS